MGDQIIARQRVEFADANDGTDTGIILDERIEHTVPVGAAVNLQALETGEAVVSEDLRLRAG